MLSNGDVRRLSNKKMIIGVILHQNKHTVFLEIAERILKTTDFQPIFITKKNTKLEKNITGIEKVEVDNTDLSYLTSIKIFITPDRIKEFFFSFPATSQVFCVPHAFVEAQNIDQLGYFSSIFEFGDAVFLPHMFSQNADADEYEKFWGGKMPELPCPRYKKFITIPCGYPKIDLVLKKIKQLNHKQDSILIAPTLSTSPANLFYEEMLSVALKFHPEYNIIFRPYPSSINDPEVQKLQKKYDGDERIIFDFNTSNLDSFARSKIFITDSSYGRITFCFATDNPYIMYRPDMYARQDISFDGYGFTTFTQEQLATTIARTLDSNEICSKVRRKREETILNFGKSIDVIVDTISAYANGEQRDYWIEFDKKYMKGDWDNPTFWAQTILNYQWDIRLPIVEVLYEIAQKKFPANTLFKLPFTSSRKVLKINYKKKDFRVLEPHEIDKLKDNPESIPPYAVWGNTYYLNKNPDVLNFHLANPNCRFFIYAIGDVYTVPGRDVVSPDHILDHEIEYVFFEKTENPTYKHLQLIQIMLSEKGW
ncbi:hypothetical protein [Desulfovibrio sp. UCD-KL4C]|uniref:hypothetical protein n=1 Tax=Desulfovibrio sp. UCD-KL4C TaxID=2578120 RepID=UPI0025C0CD2B|nr:hypothetical protein [Desulfovibrio sp. UCD-KL4C]